MNADTDSVSRGVEPDREITEEEIRGARLAVGYVANHTNVGVVGRQNEGKSSLVNSLRGLRPGGPDSAKVGEAETTKEPAAFVDKRHIGMIWHDIPGGGTRNFTAWGYYYNHRLFAYDKILLVHSATLSEVRADVVPYPVSPQPTPGAETAYHHILRPLYNRPD